MNPVSILLLISDLEGSYHHLRINGFEEDLEALDILKKKYYKMYFRLCKEQGRNPYG